MNATIDTSRINRELEQIKAMVACSRQTAAAEHSHECDMAATLLLEAENRIFALQQIIEPSEEEELAA